MKLFLSGILWPRITLNPDAGELESKKLEIWKGGTKMSLVKRSKLD